MPNTFRGQATQPDAGALIQLFTLDTSMLGGPVYRWTPSSKDGSKVRFQGLDYDPVPVEVEGFEWTSRGASPRPKMKVSNIFGMAGALAISFKDILGAKVTRICTFDIFLDGGAQANPGAFRGPDIFFVDRKSMHDDEWVEWELASVIDVENRMLPRRQIIRDTCTHSYRVWDGVRWSYGTCPYRAENYFNESGGFELFQAADKCGRRVSDCRMRFGWNAELPGRFFPSVAKLRGS